MVNLEPVVLIFDLAVLEAKFILKVLKREQTRAFGIDGLLLWPHRLEVVVNYHFPPDNRIKPQG